MLGIIRVVRRSLHDLGRSIQPSWEVLRWLASAVRRRSLEPAPAGTASSEQGGEP